MKCVLAIAAILLPFLAPAQRLETVDGITFAEPANVVFVSVRSVGKAFGWPVGRARGQVLLNNRALDPTALKTTLTGIRLVALRELRNHGAIVTSAGPHLWTIKKKGKIGRAFRVRQGMKRVFINKRAQMMVGYQGQLTVFRSRVSTGRAAKQTPTGIFQAQPYKRKLHLSRLYHGAEMPWAVHIVGNIFVHGFRTIANRPSSAGCIRLPVTGRNPARWFYYWVEPKTPVTILGKWPRNTK